MSSGNEPETAGGPLRVLIVEDNIAAAQTTGWMIEMMAFDYRLAAGGDEALALAADYVPNVVMLDIGLPGMNGFDLCAALRALPALNRTTFIAVTGWTQSHYRQRAQEAGFDHYMVKPVSYDDLLDTLTRIAEGL